MDDIAAVSPTNQEPLLLLEDILGDIGDAGRFQAIMVTLLALVYVAIAWSMFMPTVVTATPKWWCVDPTTLNFDNMTLDNTTFQTCGTSVSVDAVESVSDDNSTSNGYTTTGATGLGDCVHYFDPEMITIVSEWDLVCDRNYIKSIVISIQMAGLLVGAMLSGQTSDTIGRRRTTFGALLGHTVCCAVTGVSTSWQMFVVMRLLVGVCIGTVIASIFVYVVEFLNNRWRPYLPVVPAWPTGICLLCLTGWLLPHWRYLHFICAGFSGFTLLGFFVSPESVRWLAAKGRVSAAERVLQKIANINGRTKPADTSQRLTQLAEKEKRYGELEKKFTYLTLFKGGWRNCLKISVFSFLWMVVSLNNYGILFGVSNLFGNMYLNMSIMVLLGIPFDFMCAKLCTIIGRQKTSSLVFLLASGFAFGVLIAEHTAPAEEKSLSKSIVAISCMVMTAVAWSCIYTFAAENFPTVIRTLAFAFCDMAARVGGILAPFVLNMDGPGGLVRSYVIIGSLFAINGFLVFFIGETKGKALTDTLHQEQQDLKV